MSQPETIKGSNLSIGDHVSIRFWLADQESTEVMGNVTGIQLWNPSLIAIQVAGLHDWIQLTSTVEIGKY